MMDGLIELVFEDVPAVAVDGLVGAIARDSECLEALHSERGIILGVDFRVGIVAQFDASAQPTAVSIRTVFGHVGDVLIAHPVLRVLQVEGRYEVSVAFDRGDLSGFPDRDVVAKLALGAKTLAQNARVNVYYCGFEPAADARTRLFSNDLVGPLVNL